jgi:hypothetical protein
MTELGSRKAVFATQNGIWAMFFGIVDRDRVKSITSACVRLEGETGAVRGPFYIFAVSQTALVDQPWRAGNGLSVAAGRIFSPASDRPRVRPRAHRSARSLQPVRPIAGLVLTPEDFPFLADIRGHDRLGEGDQLGEYATALATGGPRPAP